MSHGTPKGFKLQGRSRGIGLQYRSIGPSPSSPPLILFKFFNWENVSSLNFNDFIFLKFTNYISFPLPRGHVAVCEHVSGLSSLTEKFVFLPLDFLCHRMTNITIYRPEVLASREYRF